MPNIGYADNFWGRTPPCWNAVERFSKADEIEDNFNAYGREQMIAALQAQLSAEEWEETQPLLETWARAWWFEELEGEYDREDLYEWRDEYCDFSQI